MNNYEVRLFDVDQTRLKNIMNDLSYIDGWYSIDTNGFETVLTICASEGFTQKDLSEVLSCFRQNLISADGGTLFQLLASYMDVFKKSIIIFDQGTLGYFTSQLLINLENKNLVKCAYLSADLQEIQKMFDFTNADISPLSFATDKSVYKITERIMEKNVSDILVVSLTNFSNPPSGELKFLQPKGKSVTLISDNNHTDIQTLKIDAGSGHVAQMVAQQIAWKLVNKLKFGQ